MNAFPRYDQFVNRHIGTTGPDLSAMLQTLGVNSLDELIDQTVPSHIRRKDKMNIPAAQSEIDYLNQLQLVANKNKLYRSFIGQGYFGTHTPSVILRNVFHITIP